MGEGKKITTEEFEFLRDEDGNLDKEKLEEFLAGEMRCDILDRFYNMNHIDIELLHDLTDQVSDHFNLEKPIQEIIDEFLEDEMSE